LCKEGCCRNDESVEENLIRMYSLFKKEITQFFGSIAGYIVIIVFLLTTGLFLWVFNGNYNIPDGGYATLQGLFEIAPWIYLFLIPAITMRLFADEKRNGTIELLLTRPVTEMQLVMLKFLAALAVVILTLLPTLIYYLSVYFLGNPVGAIDSGATWGSYTGLFFLAVIYLTIGLFTSSLTDNQIIAFLLALFLCFFWYSGFEFIAGLSTPGISAILTALSIDSHYESVSRGVLDTRDLLYFVLMAGFFLLLTRIVIEWKRLPLRRSLLHLLIYSLFGLAVMIFVQTHFFRIDLTSEKRYTLSPQSKQLLSRVNAPVVAEIFLEGDLPPGFKKLQAAVIEEFHDMNIYCRQPIIIKITNPYDEVKPSEQSKYFESLMQRGIVPTNLRIKTEQGTSTKLIFPAVSLRSGGNEVIVNILKNNPLLRDEENFIHSTELLEYELIRGIRLLFQQKKDKVAFLTGHNELDEKQVLDFTNGLSENYELIRVTPDQLMDKPDSIKALIIAGPENRFPERDKFIVDQYMMKGGRIMWLIDAINVSLDSLSNGMTTLALPKDLNLSDQLFHYGIRYNEDLVQDAECLQIKVNTALVGQPPKYSIAPWYFSPLLQPSQNHPIGKNVSRILSEFISSIDTVGESNGTKSSVILTTSPYARINKCPMIVSLGMIDAPPARELFNRQYIPVGILLESKFTSVFKNRMIGELGLPANTKIISESKPTKMMFFSGGHLIANKVNRNSTNKKISPLGFDPVSNITFGNKDFFINAVNWLCDDSGLMELRSRTVKMRLLDKVRLREELVTWQIINVIVPAILVLIAGILFWFFRHRRN
jgi:ABC-2 type transport system permease protein